MNGPGMIWQQAADKWSEVIAQVGEDQWDSPTPCPEFTVRELVDHCQGWQAKGAMVLGATERPADWDAAKVAITQGFSDPANLEGAAEQFGGMPKHQAVGLLIADLLVHSWDLARSIGADDTLPPEAVDAVAMGLARIPEAMRGSAFGQPVEVADDASAQDKMIALSGRQP